MKKVMNAVRYMWAFVMQATLTAAWIILVLAMMDVLSIAVKRVGTFAYSMYELTVSYWRSRKEVQANEPTPVTA